MQTHAHTIKITECLGEKRDSRQISIYIVFSSKTKEYKITTHPIKFSMYTRKIVFFLYQRRNIFSIFVVSQTERKKNTYTNKIFSKGNNGWNRLMTCRIEMWWCQSAVGMCRAPAGLRHVLQIFVFFCRFY